MAQVDSARKQPKALPLQVCKLLAEEGFRPKLAVVEGVPEHVAFKFEGRKLYFSFVTGDYRYLQLSATFELAFATKGELTPLPSLECHSD